MPSQVFPHQMVDLLKLRHVLKIVEELVKDNQDIEEDEVLGYALFLRGLIKSRYPSSRPLKEQLEIIKTKPKGDQSPLTIARDLRRLFELFGLIEERDGKLQLSERGKKIADAPKNSPLTDDEKKAWLEGLRRLRYPDDTMSFRPLRIILEMLNHSPMNSKLLAFALTIANETDGELKRLMDTIDRIRSGKSTFEKEIAEIELSETNAANNVKILPALADQLGLISRSGGVAHITSLGKSVLFEMTRPEVKTETLETPQETVSPSKRKQPFFRQITSEEELKRNWKPTSAENVDFDPKDEAERLAHLRERTNEHQDILAMLYKKYVEKGWTIGLGNFDLLALKGELALLHEVKTINANERLQIIDAIGKLTYYEAFDVPSLLKDSKAQIQKILVFSRRPDESHIAFLKNLGIWVLWFNKEGILDGEDNAKNAMRKIWE